MREIKFRGKRVDSGEWVYGVYVYYLQRHFIITYSLKEWYEIILKTIGQYTGLHDKNGKEIYEGDIVRIAEYGFGDNGEVLEDEKTEYVCQVPELTNCGWFMMIDSDPIGECTRVEVIGNIHENPELLGGELGEGEDSTYNTDRR